MRKKLEFLRTVNQKKKEYSRHDKRNVITDNMRRRFDAKRGPRGQRISCLKNL